MDKKIIIGLFTVSVFAGLGYLGFAYSPIGKATLIRFLLKRWKQIAGNKEKSFDVDYIKTELTKLKYPDLELLTVFTLKTENMPQKTENVTTKQRETYQKYMSQIKQKEILLRADLKPLESIILPG